ncbi:MAG: M48 family metallopeptidase [Parahaliea sp.]
MDFFRQQDIARRNTRLLIALFLAAVAVLIILTNAAIAGYLWFSQDYNVYSGSREGFAGFLRYFSWQRFGWTGLAITATVALVTLTHWLQFRTGGKVIAEAMGATRIVPQTRDRHERRCLNVVEEMALAANMPVPVVYVLNDERGINAFAAGLSPADAVLAVTRGALEHLKRDELQGVIGHEFSHILNGDMRLNIRLAAMLKGITFIGDMGLVLMHSSTRAKRSASGDHHAGGFVPLLGLAFWILGWFGGISAGFIKAAISRQKEYLADASAVQFTRNNTGIAQALKVIGAYVPGTLVHAARASEMSHIFFGQIRHRLWQVFATHPPLATRIRRLDPHWDGEYIKRKIQHYQSSPSRPAAAEAGVGRATVVAAAIAASAANTTRTIEYQTEKDLFGPEPAELEAVTAKREDIALSLIQHSHSELGAQALVLSLLVDPASALYQQQLTLIKQAKVQGLDDLVFTLAPGVAGLVSGQRLPLLEMCMPSLKSLSARQYQIFRQTLLQVAASDGHTSLFEWCLLQLLSHYLAPEFGCVRISRARHNHLEKMRFPLRLVLSIIACENSDAVAAFAMATQELGMPELQILSQEHITMAAFDQAVQELADSYPLLKPRILKAMIIAAGADQTLNSSERELIYAVAAVMDCPLPDKALWLLATSTSS